MGLFDKMKNYVTGGHAKVTLEHPALAFPAMPFGVKVVVVAKADFESNGVFVDVSSSETVSFKHKNQQGQEQDVNHSHGSYSHAFQVAGPFSMKEGETKEFPGSILLPKEADPTFKGTLTKHTYSIRGRIDTKGNDPDSGYVEFRVGAMS
jgi:hypothetical protein